MRWEKVVGVGILRVTWIRGGSARGPLFARPRLMAPGKQDEGEFAQNVWGGNIEIVF